MDREQNIRSGRAGYQELESRIFRSRREEYLEQESRTAGVGEHVIRSRSTEYKEQESRISTAEEQNIRNRSIQ
jgi:hypothetical protein